MNECVKMAADALYRLRGYFVFFALFCFIIYIKHKDFLSKDLNRLSTEIITAGDPVSKEFSILLITIWILNDGTLHLIIKHGGLRSRLLSMVQSAWPYHPESLSWISLCSWTFQEIQDLFLALLVCERNLRLEALLHGSLAPLASIIQDHSCYLSRRVRPVSRLIMRLNFKILAWWELVVSGHSIAGWCVMDIALFLYWGVHVIFTTSAECRS